MRRLVEKHVDDGVDLYRLSTDTLSGEPVASEATPLLPR